MNEICIDMYVLKTKFSVAFLKTEFSVVLLGVKSASYWFGQWLHLIRQEFIMWDTRPQRAAFFHQGFSRAINLTSTSCMCCDAVDQRCIILYDCWWLIDDWPEKWKQISLLRGSQASGGYTHVVILNIVLPIIKIRRSYDCFVCLYNGNDYTWKNVSFLNHQCFPIPSVMKFGKCFFSVTTEHPAKFQSALNVLTANLICTSLQDMMSYWVLKQALGAVCEVLHLIFCILCSY